MANSFEVDVGIQGSPTYEVLGRALVAAETSLAAHEEGSTSVPGANLSGVFDQWSSNQPVLSRTPQLFTSISIFARFFA